MKILITGISGRIGANLAKQLVEQGHSVRGLIWPRDPRREKLAAFNVDLVDGDLTSRSDVARAMVDIEAVYHLGAAFQGGGPFTNDEYFEINVRGTFNMLEASRERGNALRHFFYASSDAIYQKYVLGGIPEPIHEDTMPVLPSGLYPMTKRLGEDLCLDYHRTFGLPATIFRFALARAGDEILDFPQFYIEHWLQVYAHKTSSAGQAVYSELKKLEEAGVELLIAQDENGKSYRKHIVDVRDMVAGMLCALGNSEASGQAFHLAAPEAFTWEATIPYLASALGLKYGQVALRDQVPTDYSFDLSKSRAILGYQPQYDIVTMIDDAIAIRRGESGDVIPT
ncbi:MAG: NAD(P)-dependent oxidoreductase [Chloroflexota bacterium]